MPKKTLRFSEHQKWLFDRSYVTVEGQEVRLNTMPEHRLAIEKFHHQTKGTYFDLIHNGICFKEQVGVLQIGQLVIEIVPKIDQSPLDQAQWHDILLEMLKECDFLQPESSGYAHLRFKTNSILELYFIKFITELEGLLHSGLVKKYRIETGNSNALKGRLLFSRHLQKNQFHPERFFTARTIFDPHHLLHQILRQALTVIATLNTVDVFRERLQILLALWPDGKPVNISDKIFDRLVFIRSNSAYKEAVLMARMILLRYSPDLRAGANHILALMFNMNTLWEEFIFRRLKSLENECGWKVSQKKEMFYWKGRRYKKLIPDIIISDELNKVNLIIDTKWKKPGNDQPDDHDLRQLLAYKIFFEANSAYLLYPTNGKHYITNGVFHNKSYGTNNPVFQPNLALQGGLVFFNLVKDRKLISKVDFKKEFYALLFNDNTNEEVTS